MQSQFDLNKPIAVGCDHAGFEHKQRLLSFLQSKGIIYNDFGTHNKDSVDYPDFAHPVANAVETGDFSFGILLCGTANGVAITANKHKHIRAGICWNEEVGKLVRQHNDANILCIPARFVDEALAEKILETFISTDFEGGRHQNRIDKMTCG